MRKLVILLTAALALGGAALAQAASQADSLAEIESAYADFNDAAGAIGLIESDLRDSHEGRTRGEWLRLQQDARKQVLVGVDGPGRRGPVTGRPARRRDHAQEHGRCRGAGLAGARRQMRGRAAQGHRVRRPARSLVRVLRRAVELPGLRRRQGHARRRIRSVDSHGRAGTAQEAVPRVRAAVAGDQRQERARQSVSARRRDGRGARPQGRNRDRCRCEDGRCVDGGSRALAGADTGRVAQGERRYADGAVGLSLSRRRDRARARRSRSHARRCSR